LPWRLEPLHLPFSAPGLIAWVAETDLDGFNLAYAVAPETFADFVDLVAP
jgi:long-chain alkane monooxygenase